MIYLKIKYFTNIRHKINPNIYIVNLSPSCFSQKDELLFNIRNIKLSQLFDFPWRREGVAVEGEILSEFHSKFNILFYVSSNVR